MIIIISGEDEMRVMDRLLSPCKEKGSSSWRRRVWSEEEDATITESPTPSSARAEYRTMFPESDRTDKAIRMRYRLLTKNDAPRADPMDEDGQGGVYGGDLRAYQTDCMDGALCDAPIESEPPISDIPDDDTENGIPRPSPSEDIGAPPPKRARKDAWSEEEEEVIAGCLSAVGAIPVYRTAYPSSLRTDAGIKSRWNVLQHRPGPGKSVRVDLPGSQMQGKLGTVEKVVGRDCLVAVDDSPERIWCSPDHLTVVQGGSS